MGTQEIDSKSYILGVTKTGVLSDLYKVFYNRIVNNITDPHSPARIKWWYPAWPDVDIDNKDSYPIGIIHSIDANWTKKTLTKKWFPGTVVVDITSTKMSQIDDIASQIMFAIESSRAEFTKIKIKKVTMEKTSTDHAVRDKITLHTKSLPFNFEWQFDKTS